MKELISGTEPEYKRAAFPLGSIFLLCLSPVHILVAAPLHLSATTSINTKQEPTRMLRTFFSPGIKPALKTGMPMHNIARKSPATLDPQESRLRVLLTQPPPVIKPGTLGGLRHMPYYRKWLPRNPPTPPPIYFSEAAPYNYLLDAAVISLLVHSPEQFPPEYDPQKVYVNVTGVTSYWCLPHSRGFPSDHPITDALESEALKPFKPLGVQPPPRPIIAAVKELGLQLVTGAEYFFDKTYLEINKPEHPASEIARIVGLASASGVSSMHRVQALEDLAKDATEWRILEDAADRGMVFLTNEDFGRRWGGIIKAMKANGQYRGLRFEVVAGVKGMQE